MEPVKPQKKGLSAPAFNHLYGGHGNIIAWGGVADAAVSPPGQAAPTKSVDVTAAAAPVISISATSGPSLDVVRSAAVLVPDLLQGHHTFTRALTSRLAEIRELRDVWVGEGLDNLFAAVCESCHESVAVDVLHALSSCRSTGSNAGGASLIGGLPRWSWPHNTSLDWLTHVAPVLETLLFSVIEDYLVIAMTAVGHVQEALGGLWSVAARCSPRDLLMDHSEESDDSAEGEGKGGAEYEDCVGDESNSDCRRIAARQAVEAVRLTTPLLAALRHTGQYRGRRQKAAAARLERLVDMHAAMEGLVSASAAGGRR